MDLSPESLIKLNEQLRTDAGGMQRLWAECGRMCLTRKVSSLLTAISQSGTQDGSMTPDTRLLNTIAVESNEGLASGLMSWVMPYEGRWFCWKPAPEQDGNEALEEWLAASTEIALTALASSNFYTAAHEALLDRGTFGTASLWAQAGKRNPLMFRCWDAGTFVIAEDEEGYVDTVFREMELTAQQAAEMFAKLPPQVAGKLGSRPMDRDRYLHVICPRPEAQRSTNGGPLAMPVASITLHKDSKLVVNESGFEELPAIVTRHLRWSEASAYGASPAMKALAEIRGVNYLELLMSTLAETQVNPRLILPQGYEGTPDLRAGGITMGGLTPDAWPREWMTQGNMNFGLALIERKEEAVRQAFHAKLFDLFSTRKGDLNIPHVQALQAEQLGRISPAFTSLTPGFINPILERVFMILYRSGKLPPPPPRGLCGQCGGCADAAVPARGADEPDELARQLLIGGYDPDHLDPALRPAYDAFAQVWRHPDVQEVKTQMLQAQAKTRRSSPVIALKAGDQTIGMYSYADQPDGSTTFRIDVPDREAEARGTSANKSFEVKLPTVTQQEYEAELARRKQVRDDAATHALKLKQEDNTNRDQQRSPWSEFWHSIVDDTPLATTGHTQAEIDNATDALVKARKQYEQLLENGRDVMIYDRLRNELAKEEYRDRVGEYNRLNEFAKGVVDVGTSALAIPARAVDAWNGNDEQMQNVARVQQAYEGAYPDSTRPELEDSYWGRQMQGVRRSAGSMLPLLGGGWVARRLAGAEAIATGHLGVPGAGSVLTVTGQDQLHIQQRIDELRASGDSATADRLSNGRDLHSVLTGIIAGTVERMSPAQMLRPSGQGWGHLAYDAVMEGSVENMINGGVQRALVDPLLNDGRVVPPSEFLASAIDDKCGNQQQAKVASVKSS